MIIDTHTHTGRFEDINCSCETLISCMDSFGVSRAIVSDITCNEYDYSQNFIKTDKNQIDLNDLMLDKIKKYNGRLKALFWIRLSEQPDDKLIDYLSENREWYLGLKVHPRCANLKFSIENYNTYINLCGELHIPFCIHTESDGFSDIDFVYQAAIKYPDINFIAVHMECGSDHEKAFRYIKECPNLYGDTTLVGINDVIRALNKCGSKKILFGSDAAVFGKDSYEKYSGFRNELRKQFPDTDINNLFCNNAKRIFKNI